MIQSLFSIFGLVLVLRVKKIKNKNSSSVDGKYAKENSNDTSTIFDYCFVFILGSSYLVSIYSSYFLYLI